MSRILTCGAESQADELWYSFEANWTYQLGTWNNIDPHSGLYMFANNANVAGWEDNEYRFDECDVLIMRMAFCCDDPSSSMTRMRWGDLSKAEWGSIEIRASTLGAYVAWGSLGEAIPIDDFAWVADRWYILEVQAEHDIGGGNSRLTVRIDCNEVYTNSGNWGVSWSGIDRFTFGRYGNSTTEAWTIDDIVLQNDLTSYNRGWPGDTLIVRIEPTGAGTHTDLLVSGAAANWQAVDEIPPSDAEYVYGYGGSMPVLGHDTYVHADVTLPDSAIVRNVVEEIRARTWSAGVGYLEHSVLTGGSLADGGSLPLQPDWAHHQFTWRKNPQTGNDWQDAEIDAAEFGYELL